MTEEQAEREEQLKAITELKQAYSRCFQTSDGKRVLADLETVCRYNVTTWDKNTPLTEQMLINEGMRTVCIRIKNMMDMEKIPTKGK